jgi:transposase
MGADTTRDQRRDAKLMYRLGYTQNQIGLGLRPSRNQVQYAVTHDESPVKRPGRPSKLSRCQLEELEAFITSNQANCLVPFSKLPAALGWNVGEYCIRHALRKLGYQRHIARVKPPISEKNRELRLAWALEHRDWTLLQWASILWTDETWVSPGIHKGVWVTRKAGEELDPTCIFERIRKKGGWMFCGCISGGADKGPSLF